VEREQARVRLLEQQRVAERFSDRCRRVLREVDGNQDQDILGGGGQEGDDDDDDDENDDEDDDDDYDFDDDESDVEDDDLDLRPRRRIMKRKPPKNSVLAIALDRIKNRITCPEGKEILRKGRQWYLPESDPVSSLSCNAENWYKEQPVFAFLPFSQYQGGPMILLQGMMPSNAFAVIRVDD
jgi:hypothetical protein